MPNDLITSDSSILLRQICGAVDVDQVKKMIRQLEAIKVALEAIDRFHEKSVLYAQLEAEAYLRLIELGGIKELRGYKRKTAEWLSEMTSEERHRWIAECKNGITIVEVYKSQFPPYTGKTDQEKKEDVVKLARELIEENVEESKPIDLHEYAETVRVAHSNKSAYDGLFAIKQSDTAVDEVRHYLRSKGYVGIGENAKKYFPAKKEYKEEIVKAIRQRTRSIISDIYSLQNIINRSEIGKLSCSDFIWETDWKMTHDSGSKEIVYCLMIALWQLDLFDDLDAFERTYHIRWNRENEFVREYGGWYLRPGCEREGDNKCLLGVVNPSNTGI